MITSTKKTLLRLIPNCKSKIPEQLGGAGFSPHFVGTQNQLAIRDELLPKVFPSQLFYELITVIDPGVSSHH